MGQLITIIIIIAMLGGGHAYTPIWFTILFWIGMGIFLLSLMGSDDKTSNNRQAKQQQEEEMLRLYGLNWKKLRLK